MPSPTIVETKMHRYRTLRWFVVLPLVLVSSTALVGAKPSALPLACEVASSWVAAHRDSLPKTLAEFHKYPLEYQLAIYGELSSDVRVALWREKLEPYLLPSSGLAESQRAIVREFYDGLAVYVTDPTGKRGREAFSRNALPARARAVFGR